MVDQDTHETSPQHKRALQELLRRTRRFLQVRDAARNLSEQMDEQLSPHGPWQGKIYEIIGRTAMDADPTSVIQDAHKLLRQYQHWERISLLELAVWKFACLNSMDNENGKASFLEWSRWFESGWKQHKKSHYRSDQVVIVMKAIVPFLRQYETTKDKEQDDTDHLENLESPENHELDSADDLDRTTDSDRTKDSNSDDGDDSNKRTVPSGPHKSQQPSDAPTCTKNVEVIEIMVGAMGHNLWFGPSNRNLLVGTRGILITHESLCGFGLELP